MTSVLIAALLIFTTSKIAVRTRMEVSEERRRFRGQAGTGDAHVAVQDEGSLTTALMEGGKESPPVQQGCKDLAPDVHLWPSQGGWGEFWD
jgi:hypothetical protein